MAEPQSTEEQSKRRISKVIVPSPSGHTGGEETEIATYITIPPDGGWGWVVVASCFICIFLIDGIIFTYGSMFACIRDDLKIEESLVALINSLAFAVSFILAPIASGIINRYGFRECTMAGAIICGISLLLTYFAHTYALILVFYGLFNGFGASLVYFAASLFVGFYFERLRALAMSIALTGSSFGTMIMYAVNNKMNELGGWRNTTLLHAGLLGALYFIGMTFKPVTPVLVTHKTEHPPVVVTNLPSGSNDKGRGLFQSNTDFPTAESVIQEGVVTESGVVPETRVVTETGEVSETGVAPSTSRKNNSKSTLLTVGSEIDERVLTRICEGSKCCEVNVAIEPPKKRSFWARLCHWKKQAPEFRPMYRDDVFYSGSLNSLETYKRSRTDVESNDKTSGSVKYHMAVTRAAKVKDIKEKKSLCSTAVRRALVSMFDPSILKTCSLLIVCLGCFFNYLGMLVPYVFLQERNLHEGMDPIHCKSILSFIGFTNILGKLLIAPLAFKISPIILYIISVSVSGLTTIAFNFSFNVYYQYTCAGIFGFFIAALTALRSLIFVRLYGLERLTSATGVLFIYQGVGSLLSTPLTMIIKASFGYTVSFYTAGLFMLTNGALFVPLQTVRRREIAKEKQRMGNNEEGGATKDQGTSTYSL